jgi:cell shape-determining protein MreC
MMMISYQRNNRGTPFLSVTIGVILVVALGFLVDAMTGGFLRTQVRQVSGAALSSTASIGVAVEGSGFFSSRRSLQTENEALQRELSLSMEKLASFQMLQRENEELRGMAALALEEPGVTARVVSSHRTTPYGAFMIGAGSRDGIIEGAFVLTEGGYVLGVVTSVAERTAMAKMIFAPNEKIDLVVRDIAFSAEGSGGGNARAEVPREAELAVGDAAFAPTFGGRATGLVGYLESASSSATQTVLLRIPVNLDALRFVYVVNR